jgi:glutamyl-tRNA synthetase
MAAEARTRYAPSPTGYMHIGNLRTALYEYLIAKKNNGIFILRIEDTDQERLVEGAVDVIYKTLEIAGLKHDEGPDIGGDFGPYIQSERKPLYLEYAKKLVDLGKAYYCFCTKERLAEAKEKCEAQGKVFRYDRHCLSLTTEEIEAKLAAGEPYVIRQKMPDSGTTAFEDVVYGRITVDNSELEDQVLLKSDGLPTYNFANVVDDHLMKITHVVRGNEYLSSTPKYNLLYQAFGWELPTYIHLPHIMKDATHKLSKRNGDASFQDLLDKGYLAEAILNYIALLGWSPGGTEEFFTLKELEKSFTIDGLSKSQAIIDTAKLTWMNAEYIRRLSNEQFYEKAKPWLQKAACCNNTDCKSPDLYKIAKLIQPRTEIFSEIPEKVAFFWKLPDYSTDIYCHKKMKTDKENSLVNLKKAHEFLYHHTGNWSSADLYEALCNYASIIEIKNSQILWPIRTALSGQDVSPGGATELAEILGKDETLRRMEIGINLLSEGS